MWLYNCGAESIIYLISGSWEKQNQCLWIMLPTSERGYHSLYLQAITHADRDRKEERELINAPPQYAIKLKDLAKADKRHPTLFCCALSLSTPTHFTPPIPSLLLHLDSWGPRSHISGNFLKCHSSRRPEWLNSMGSIAARAVHIHRAQWALLSPSSRLPTRWLSPQLRHLAAKSVQPCMHLCVSKPPLSLAFLRPPPLHI